MNFCLNSELCQPYRKPNDEPLYIISNSNHSLTILPRLPQTIIKRISSLSSNQELFSKVALMYTAALEDAGYTEKINYDSKINENEPSRNRKRNIIWHNPSYNKYVYANLGRVFLSLFDRQFCKQHKLSKILNRNSVKLSNSCTIVALEKEHIVKNHYREITVSSIEKGVEASCNC